MLGRRERHRDRGANRQIQGLCATLAGALRRGKLREAVEAKRGPHAAPEPLTRGGADNEAPTGGDDALAMGISAFETISNIRPAIALRHRRI